MTPSRWARRTDASQQPVFDTLRRLGWSVLDLSRVGGGCPDALIAKGDRMALCEVKSPDCYYGKRLSDSQQLFASTWPTQILILRTPEDALAWVLTGQTPDSTTAD